MSSNPSSDARGRIRRGRKPAPNRSVLVSQVQRQLDDGIGIADACAELGISPASYYRWRVQAESEEISPDVARQLVIDAAKAAFKERGMDASLSAIAEAAGVARQTIYNLYGSKKLLLLDVLRNIYADLLVLDHDPDETESLDDALNLFGKRFMEMAVDDDALMINRLTISQYRTDPEISRMTFELAQQNSRPGLTARLAAYLKRQKALGRITCDDPQLTAGAFQSAVSGSARLRALAGVVQSQEALDAHLACTISLFLRGLAAPGSND